MSSRRSKPADVVAMAVAGNLDGAREQLRSRMEADPSDASVFIDGWRIAEALESEDDAVAWVQDGLGQGIDLLSALRAMPAAERAALLTSEACRWPHLAVASSSKLRSEFLLARIEALIGTERFAQARRELDDPELRRDATDEEHIAVAALRALVALAWHDPSGAVEAAAGFDGAKSDDATQARGRLAAVLAIAAAWNAICEKLEIPQPLRAFIRRASMMGRTEREAGAAGESVERAEAIAVRSILETEPAEVMFMLARASREHPMIALYLVQLFTQLSADGVPTLAELGKDEFDALGRALVDLNDELSTGLPWWQVIGVAVAARVGLDLAGAGIAADLLAWGGAMTYLGRSLARDKERYDGIVRPKLAALVVRTGTPAKCIVSWLAKNGRMAKRVRNFDVAIEADDGLALLALLSRAVHSAAA